MRNVRIIVLSLFIAVLFACPPLLAADASCDAGFRGIGWGEDLSVNKDMRLISCEDQLCSYVRSMEDLNMEGAVLNSVVYRSLGGRFVETVIEAPVETDPGQPSGPQSKNFLAFRQLCQERFGKTSFAASFEALHADQYRWEYTNIRKVLKVNFNKNRMELTITDHDLAKGLEDSSAEISEHSGQSNETQHTDVRNPEEVTPVQTDAGDGTSGESAPAEKKDGKIPTGVKKVGKFLKWLFVNDDTDDENDLSREIPY